MLWFYQVMSKLILLSHTWQEVLQWYSKGGTYLCSLCLKPVTISAHKITSKRVKLLWRRSAVWAQTFSWNFADRRLLQSCFLVFWVRVLMTTRLLFSACGQSMEDKRKVYKTLCDLHSALWWITFTICPLHFLTLLSVLHLGECWQVLPSVCAMWERIMSCAERRRCVGVSEFKQGLLLAQCECE